MYLVAPEKHDGARIVELIHGVEIRNNLIVDRVDDGEVFDDVGKLEEVLVHGHAGGVGVGTEAQDDEA
jgi:hypothetical protein